VKVESYEKPAPAKIKGSRRAGVTGASGVERKIGADALARLLTFETVPPPLGAFLCRMLHWSLYNIANLLI